MKDTLRFVIAVTLLVGMAYVLYFLNDPFAIIRWVRGTAGFLLNEGFLLLVAEIVLTACISILLPLAIVRKTRAFSAFGLVIAANLFGVILWFWSLAITVSWGVPAFVIGLFTLTLGFVPIAMVKAGLESRWLVLGQLCLLFSLFFGLRLLAHFFLRKSPKDNPWARKLEIAEWPRLRARKGPSKPS